MLLKDKTKWYCVISGCVFLALITYIRVAYVFSTRRLDQILGYLTLTTGLAALIFGLMFLAKPESVKIKVEWWGVISGYLFLAVSTYTRLMSVYFGADVRASLYLLAVASALSSLTFGLLSFPKWQSYFALAVWLYSFYWFAQPTYVIN